MLQRQLELEEDGVQAGIRNYRDQVTSGRLLDLPAGVTLVASSMKQMVTALEEFMAPQRGSSRMQGVRSFFKRLQVTTEEIAFITLQFTIHEATQKSAVLQNAALTLADRIMDQHEYNKFKSNHKGLLKKIEEGLTIASQKHRRTVVMLKKRQKGIEDDIAEREDKLLVGCKLIELMILSTGLVQRETDHKRDKEGRSVHGAKGEIYVLNLTPQALKWIEKVHDRCELLNPVLLPMIIPPRKWEGIKGGGYLANSATLKFKLIKTRDRASLSALETVSMPKVYDSLNSIQETPWRINRAVYGVMSILWAAGATLGGLPKQEREPAPNKPWSSDEEYELLKATQPEVVQQWKRLAAEKYEKFIRATSSRTSTAMKLRVAEKFIDEEAIYFPHVLDWRGRVYPVVNHLHPQGDDLAKALIHFSKGKPLGTTGGYWLMVHLANTYGYDKASYSDRIQWVRDNESAILDSAENPLDGHRFWAGEEVDSPYCFLAACLEYKGYKEQGESFVSHLPVALDGTCSGLQHFSAMLRDEVGGEAVNLLPSDKPQDIYQRVADVVSEMVAEDAAAGAAEAILWLGKIDRGMAKRAVMTSPYGAKKYGFRDQLLAELKKRGGGYLTATQQEQFQACIYLADKLWDAIGTIVIAAREAMTWIQEVAGVCTEAGVAITWTTPVGFKARQEYKESNTKRIDTFWGGTRAQLSLQHEDQKIDKRKQKNGLAPNFVHSMDAAHLMSTVSAAVDHGITDFAMIHDSFGTHAGNVGTLASILRETFVEQYSVNILEKFRDEIASQLPEEFAVKLPPVPAYGNLELEAVKRSEYFFA